MSRRDTFVRPVLTFEARCINLAAENGHFSHIAFRPMTVVAVGRAAQQRSGRGIGGGLQIPERGYRFATSRTVLSGSISGDLAASAGLKDVSLTRFWFKMSL